MALDESGSESPITSINVTPLVDVTLVLLIIFMVTARLMASPRAMNVDLPRAASGSETQEIFNVVISARGEVEIDGERAERDEEIVERARTARQQNRDLRAVIQADAAVAHRSVMRVLDLLRSAGVSRIGFGVVPLDDTSRQQ